MQRALLLALAALLALSACAKSPYTNRTQFMLIGASQELALGEQAARQVLAREQVSRDDRAALRVGMVGARIAAVAGRPDFRWEFTLLDKPKEKNAFCLPGGRVFVYSGILELAPADEDLAVVLAHEIAHALARHGAERMSIGLAAQLGGQIAGLALNIQNPVVGNVFSQAYGLASEVGLILPYSREQEYEADEIGLILMAKAGFDPETALRFWRRMAAQEKGGLPAWLDTHPASGERIRAIERKLPAVRRDFSRPTASVR